MNMGIDWTEENEKKKGGLTKYISRAVIQAWAWTGERRTMWKSEEGTLQDGQWVGRDCSS